MNYKDSGVDIEAGRDFVERLMKKAPAIGGFSGMARVPSGYEKPILVSGADGVGTKINICKISRNWKTIGIDLVAMCVNDVITCGAEPLYFLDYICTSDIKLHGELVKELVAGIAEGCKQSGCSLLGGETAEHPRRSSMVDPIRDTSGFCTGIVEESQIIDGRLIRESDVIIGIESSGLHSNGYSIVNYLARRLKLNYATHPELLTPTTIYAPVVKRLLEEFDDIYGMAHITGGGIPENLPRCLPKGLKAHVDYNSWPLPEIFKKIQLEGNVDEDEMKRVFNLGIGYCVVVPDNIKYYVMDVIRTTGIDCWEIGEVYESSSSLS